MELPGEPGVAATNTGAGFSTVGGPGFKYPISAKCASKGSAAGLKAL